MSTDMLPMVGTTRFHLSLNVNDLSKSVPFLTALLGCPPKKHRADYAKFEPDDLPIVLSLEPRLSPQLPLRSTAGEGPLNHVGIRMGDAAQLVEVQRRLEAAGYSTQREDGVECCYARQTKFWILDNDRTLWEVYVLDEDLDHRGGAPELPAATGMSPAASGPTPDSPTRTWTHRLSEDFPISLPASLPFDEIVLQGSWNARRHQGQWRSQMATVHTALRPGGKLVLHFLTSNQPISELQPLPGPAAAVEVVPPLRDVLQLLAESGFVDTRLVKFSGTPCFVQNASELRETRIEAIRAFDANPAPEPTVQVLYKGPLPEIVDDGGQRFPRGVVVPLARSAWQRLSAGPLSDSFVKLAEPEENRLHVGVRCGGS